MFVKNLLKVVVIILIVGFGFVSCDNGSNKNNQQEEEEETPVVEESEVWGRPEDQNLFQGLDGIWVDTGVLDWRGESEVSILKIDTNNKIITYSYISPSYIGSYRNKALFVADFIREYRYEISNKGSIRFLPYKTVISIITLKEYTEGSLFKNGSNSLLFSNFELDKYKNLDLWGTMDESFDILDSTFEVSLTDSHKSRLSSNIIPYTKGPRIFLSDTELNLFFDSVLVSSYNTDHVKDSLLEQYLHEIDIHRQAPWTMRELLDVSLFHADTVQVVDEVIQYKKGNSDFIPLRRVLNEDIITDMLDDYREFSNNWVSFKIGEKSGFSAIIWENNNFSINPNGQNITIVFIEGTRLVYFLMD
jgi:hypothetical protein